LPPKDGSYDKKAVGILLKASRKSLGISIEALAKRLGGISVSQISRIESGESGTLEACIRVASALGISHGEVVAASRKTAPVDQNGETEISTPVKRRQDPGVLRFDQKLLEHAEEKLVVAQTVVDGILLPEWGKAAFSRQVELVPENGLPFGLEGAPIPNDATVEGKNLAFVFGDGTSIVPVWEHLMKRWKQEVAGYPLQIATNNYHIVRECTSLIPDPVGTSDPFPLDMDPAPGRFSPRDRATRGSRTNAWATEVCRDRLCVMAATSLDAQNGPSAYDMGARYLKAAFMRASPRLLIVIADSNKLAGGVGQPADPAEWMAWLRGERSQLWVVTTVAPRVYDLVYGGGSLDSLTLEEQAQCQSVKELRKLLQERFKGIRAGGST
jgi:transcriptional regulator with XRE-family HTH domain